MIYVLTPDEMRAADAAACERVGEIALMREAGSRIAELIRARHRGGRIVAFAGPGNNGGDALAALANLDAGYERIAYVAPNDAPSPARADAAERARAAGVRVLALPTSDDDALGALAEAACALDGLFGTGARLPLGEAYRAAARALNRARTDVIALDIPSGIDALTGSVDENAVRASATVALAALKPGLLLQPARERAGELWLAQIGISEETLREHARTYAALDDDAFLDLLPTRPVVADKRSAGAPLIIAGSAQFPGAAVLCARAAARAGAGYVTVATPVAAAPALRSHLIEQVVVTLLDGTAEACADDLLDVARRCGAVAIGPGLGLDERTGHVVRAFVERVDLPLVLDASALFHFAKRLELLRGKQCVLTPHAGEFARLSGQGTIAAGTRVARLREFVARTGIVTLLKGSDTLIADDTCTHINATGTPALATAGTGDVLTGMIATLLAQGLSPVDAARAAAYWHGRAGQLCAAQRAVGVVAGDLPDALAAALPTRREPAPLSRYA
ncbi:MAG: NAD(P)H-hydrate dehydratase [bacterium]|nr:NAD(P)H-hydrate dehydratase [bacterium]